MELSPFSRGVAAGTLNLMNLLRLAKAADANPLAVLRLAGKSAEADLIEELFGTAHERIAASDRELLETWRLISPKARLNLRTLMETLAHKGQARRDPLTDEHRKAAQKRERSA